MASDKEYLDYVLERLSPLDEFSCRSMMGEYILYSDGKAVGGIYDDRFLLKATESALGLLKERNIEMDRDIPYEGAREMLVADIDDPNCAMN